MVWRRNDRYVNPVSRDWGTNLIFEVRLHLKKEEDILPAV